MDPSIVLLLLVASTEVELDSPHTCTTTVALFEAIAPRIPEPIPLHVEVQLRASTPAHLAVHIALDIAGTSTATREVEIAVAECPLLPRLVASIAERYVIALPHRDWAAIVRARRLEVIRPEERPPSTPAARDIGWRLGIEVGGASGIDTPSTGLVAAAMAELGPSDGLRATAIVFAGVWPGLALGDGALDTFSASLGAGPGYAFEAASLVWTAALQLAGGVNVGRGRGFDAASTQTVGLLEIGARLGVRLDTWHLALAAQTALLRPSFVRVSTGDRYDAPIVRVALTIGWSAWVD